MTKIKPGEEPDISLSVDVFRALSDPTAVISGALDLPFDGTEKPRSVFSIEIDGAGLAPGELAQRMGAALEAIQTFGRLVGALPPAKGLTR